MVLVRGWNEHCPQIPHGELIFRVRRLLHMVQQFLSAAPVQACSRHRSDECTLANRQHLRIVSRFVQSLLSYRLLIPQPTPSQICLAECVGSNIPQVVRHLYRDVCMQHCDVLHLQAASCASEPAAREGRTGEGSRRERLPIPALSIARGYAPLQRASWLAHRATRSWPYSSVVEHTTADRGVSCSNHDGACLLFYLAAYVRANGIDATGRVRLV